MKTVLTLLCVMTTLSAVDALHCYECLYNYGSSDNEPMTLIVNVLSKNSEQACKYGGGDTKVECGKGQGELPMGHRWVCAKNDIRTTISHDFDIGRLEAELRIVDRGCVAAITTEDKYSIGCRSASNFRDKLTSELIEQRSSVKRTSDFRGETCFCDTDSCNSAPGHITFSFLVFLMSLCAVLSKYAHSL